MTGAGCGVRGAVRTVIALGALLTVACALPPKPPIASVALKVLPAAGGTTWVQIDSTGKISGGRISGTPPTTFEESTMVSRDSIKAIFDQAAGLGDTLLRNEGVAPPEPQGSNVIGILFEDGSQARIVWPDGSDHPDPRVQRLTRLILARKVGGW